MPELPELQAHAERLTDDFGGAVVDRFEALSFTALKTFDPRPEAMHGQALQRVDRRGKHLLLHIGELTAVVHLMQGGRLRPDDKKSRKPRGGVARWTFEDGRALLLTEAGTEHRAGVWVVAGDASQQPPLKELGPEADHVDVESMQQLLAEHSMRLHTFLRDQRIIAGMGRRLANEVCHGARLSPFASTRKLGAQEAAAIVAAIGDAVAAGLEVDRARDDMSSSGQRPSAVHARTGEPCPVCGDVVRAVEYRDYTVNYCATCQTGGKVLADNTFSKLGIAQDERTAAARERRAGTPRSRAPRRR
jgi:formamidopyrimidine-DNA glycosylase